MLEIRPAGPEDMGAIRVLLAVCLLPSQDLNDDRCTFFVAESERGIIGVCGAERCDSDISLLRSLGVMPGYRKQQIGRRLVQRVIGHAESQKVDRLYLLTETANNYFQTLGFVAIDRKKAPAELKSSPFLTQHLPSGAILMTRALRSDPANLRSHIEAKVATRAKQHFDNGYLCSESVLLAAAEHAGIQSPLIPAIATGFCHGTARTWGTCGALSGGILAINLTHGRNSPEQSTSDNYQAVRKLIDAFDRACGSSRCSELIGCDLDTREGQKIYQDSRLRTHCREFIGVAAGISAHLIEIQKEKLGIEDGSSAKAFAS